MEREIKNFLSALTTWIADDYSEYCVITELIDVLRTQDKTKLIHELKQREREKRNRLLDNQICPDCGGNIKFHQIPDFQSEKINWNDGYWQCEDCGEEYHS